MGTNDPSLLSQVRSHTGAIEEIVQAARAQALTEGYEAGARMILRTLHQRDRDRLHEQHQRDNELLQRLLDERADLKPETVHQPVYSGPMSEAKFDPGLTILPPQDERTAEPDIREVRRAVRERSLRNQLPSTPLEELGLRAWTLKVLHDGRIYTVGHLLDTPSNRFSRIPCVSRAILEEIDGCLAQYYLKRPRDADFEYRVWNYQHTS